VSLHYRQGLRYCSSPVQLWHYANQVSNLDPTMLALCPLHLTIIEQAGTTTVLFNRPSVAATGSAALEDKVITAIKRALQA